MKEWKIDEFLLKETEKEKINEKLLLEFFETVDENDWTYENFMEEMKEENMKEKRFILMNQEQTKILGCIDVVDDHEMEWVEHNNFWKPIGVKSGDQVREIKYLFLHPSIQKNGIGKKIVSILEKTNPFDKIILFCYWEAYGFWTHLGYQPIFENDKEDQTWLYKETNEVIKVI